MKVVMSAACLATVCALAAGPGLKAQGQGQGQSQTPPQTQTPPQRADMPSLTLNGCLERDTSATGTAGATGTTTGAFKLTNVTAVPTAATRTGTGTGTGQQQQQQQRAAGQTDDDKTYRLSAASGVDLNEHVGHQVEVVGSIVKTNASASSATPAKQTGQTGQTGQQQQRAGEDKDKDAPLVMVSSVRLVASTCR